MGWVAGARLVSATANAGGLGILAGATMTSDQFVAAIREVKERTDKPFGVNLRGDQPDAFDRADVMIQRGRAGRELRAGAVGAVDQEAARRGLGGDADDRREAARREGRRDRRRRA